MSGAAARTVARRARRRAAVALAGLAAVVALAGCSIAAEAEPRIIAADKVPEDLRQAPQEGATELPSDLVQRHWVFLVKVPTAGGQPALRGVQRAIPRPANVNGALHSLFDVGLLPAEAEAGLTNYLVDRAEVLQLHTDEDVKLFRVELDEDLAGLEKSALSLALAQIVFTVTEGTPDAQVELLVNDQLVDFRLPGGSLEARVGRDDFPDYAVEYSLPGEDRPNPAPPGTGTTEPTERN
ncbi:MAG: GerMN domain-containing protein [Acidimicrobiia bacterium]|nr:GerMN domain-containing protein [Acidimicrobiia bacterium]